MMCMRVGSVRKSGVFALLVIIAGCGGQSGVPEKSSSLTKAADTPASAAKTTESVAGKAARVARPADPAVPVASSPAAIPATQPAVKPASPAVPAEPADTRQLAKVLDLGKLPAPEGAKVKEQFATKLQVTVPMKVPVAVEFYKARLKAVGWQQVGNPASSTVTDAFAQVSIGKDGYELTLTAMPGEPNEANVTIAHVGNLDTRTLPRVDPAEDQYSCPTSSLYFTSVKVNDAAATLRLRLKADGWQEYDQAFTQKADRPDTADLLFLKKAYTLGVTIDRPQAQPGKTAIRYYVSTLSHDLPAPTDARNVEIQDSQWILMCEVPRSQASTMEYYRKAMQEIGFPARPHDAPSGKTQTISFESDQHDVVLVSLTSTDDQATKVKLEGYTAAFLQAMKEAEAKDKIKREAREKEEARAKAERVKAFEAASKQQDDMINSAIGKALQEAAQPGKKTDLSKKIEDDVKAQLAKAFQGAGLDEPADPDDQPAKMPEKPEANPAGTLADATPVKTVEADPKTPAGPGGTAEGQLTVDANVRKLAHAYAYSEKSDSGKTQVIVILSDASLTGVDLRDAEGLRKLATAGKLHCLRITIGDGPFGEGKAAISNDFFDEAIGSPLMIAGLDRFEDPKVDAKTISGRLHLEAPHETNNGVKVNYDVKFSAPIQRSAE